MSAIRREAAEIVAARDRRQHGAGFRDHGRVEVRSLIRMLLEVRE